ncbi:TA system VapC family ribonuclease toxin [Rhodoferax sp.]|uniref:TA system VapC family ribonuclease toxin n=1 Tax=Rhodoferax sp. TaxID=50421 RepID=UPI0026168E82|nr:TA system VapC family ribonuclease toxin [Rhodoferax sp.]MDD2810539.1 PIN domain-containing protein [Rhodoferax sp.]
MTRYLLDVNVLIALIDPAHVQHDKAHTWFVSTGRQAWATCPLTENGVLRIVGHTRYPNSPGNPAAVATLMAEMRSLPGHVFWPDDVSLHDPQIVDQTLLKSSGQLTDTYLLALACAHGGQLATFDARLVTDAVRDGVAGLCVLK